MPKTAATHQATNDAVALLKAALDQGHSVVLSLAAPPRIHHPPPLVTTCSLLFGLTPSEARVLVTLLEHGLVGRKDLHAAMSDGRGASKIKTVDVVINRVRQKLAGHGIGITTVWKAGYKLDEDDRGRLRGMLAAPADERETRTSITE